MKTVTQKDDGRFERLNINIDNITEVDLIVKLIRDAQDSHNYKTYSDNEKFVVDGLLEELEQITHINK